MDSQAPKDPRPRSRRLQKDVTASSTQLPGEETLEVRLTRKLAEVIDGVSLADANVGDRLELSQHDAEILIAEGWAERSPRRRISQAPQYAHAADKSRRRKRSGKR